MDIQLHHLQYSRSLRIMWMLEELALDYSVREWKRDKNFRAPDEARSVHPLGRFPMLEVDGLMLAESGAILEYFADRNTNFRPSDPGELQEYRFFLHYAEGSAMPPLLVQLILDKLRAAPMPLLAKPIAKGIAAKLESSYSGPALDLHLGFIDQTLADRDYFSGGTFSMADIQMFYPVEAGLHRGTGTRDHMKAWLKRVTDRPAYKKALAKGGSAMPPKRS